MAASSPSLGVIGPIASEPGVTSPPPDRPVMGDPVGSTLRTVSAAEDVRLEVSLRILRITTGIA